MSDFIDEFNRVYTRISWLTSTNQTLQTWIQVAFVLWDTLWKRSVGFRNLEGTDEISLDVQWASVNEKRSWWTETTYIQRYEYNLSNALLWLKEIEWVLDSIQEEKGIS